MYILAPSEGVSRTLQSLCHCPRRPFSKHRSLFGFPCIKCFLTFLPVGFGYAILSVLAEINLEWKRKEKKTHVKALKLLLPLPVFFCKRKGRQHSHVWLLSQWWHRQDEACFKVKQLLWAGSCPRASSGLMWLFITSAVSRKKFSRSCWCGCWETWEQGRDHLMSPPLASSCQSKPSFIFLLYTKLYKRYQNGIVNI